MSRYFARFETNIRPHESQPGDAPGSRIKERFGAGVHGRARGHHIIHQYNAFALDPFRVFYTKHSAYIGLTGLRIELRLGSRLPYANQIVLLDRNGMNSLKSFTI